MLDLESSLILIGWLLGFYFFVRPAKPSTTTIPSHPKISIIIPARNEESNIHLLLESLFQQSVRPFEIIVVNDHSTDRTKEIATRRGVTVIDLSATPEGWAGKTYGCFEGAKAARGDYFLFMDADVQMEPEALAKLASIAHQLKGAISFLPWHTVVKSYESLSAVFNLVMAAGTKTFSFSNRNPSLLGQTLLISKNHYETVGGHEVVKNRVLENFYLTDFLHQKNIPTQTYNGKGLFRMRMFPEGVESLIQSWMKGFVTGAAKVPMILMLSIILWMSGGLTVFFQIVFKIVRFEVNFMSIAIYFLYVAQMRWMLRKIGNYPWKTALLYPYYIGFFIALFTYSLLTKAMGRKGSWKGRSVG